MSSKIDIWKEHFLWCTDPSICMMEMFLRQQLMWLVNILRWNVLTTAFLTSCPAHISRLNESSFLHFLSTQICKCMQDRADSGWTLNPLICFVSSGSAWSLDIIVGKCGQDERIPDMPGPALLVCNRNLITHPACVYVYPQYSHHAYPEHPLYSEVCHRNVWHCLRHLGGDSRDWVTWGASVCSQFISDKDGGTTVSVSRSVSSRLSSQ